MAYNFKSIADVEVVAEPTESANVLIEENGVIKKAPKTAVGGAGGSEADLVIEINRHIENATIDNISIVSGSVEAVYTAFESGKIPAVEVQIIVPPTTDSYIRTGKKIPAQIIFYGDALFVGFISTDIGGVINWTCKIVFDSANNYELCDFYKAKMTLAD